MMDEWNVSAEGMTPLHCGTLIKDKVCNFKSYSKVKKSHSETSIKTTS